MLNHLAQVLESIKGVLDTTPCKPLLPSEQLLGMHQARVFRQQFVAVWGSEVAHGGFETIGNM